MGDFVLVHFPPGTGLVGANKKFTANWRGVYRIRKQLGPTTFLVGKSHGRSTKVPADRLKNFNAYVHLDNKDIMINPADDTDVIEKFERFLTETLKCPNHFLTSHCQNLKVS